MFVMGIISSEIELALNCWNIGVIFLVTTLLNKSSWIIWVVLKRTDR